MLKRMIAFFAAAAVLFCAAASAAVPDRADYVVASGTVAAVSFADVTAPFSGTLLSFDLEKGDRVSAGDVLFPFQTRILRAPADGRVTAVFGTEGADAAGVITRYGALASLEIEGNRQISASTSGAYNKSKNRELHVGETLYFQSNTGDKEKGHGMVTAVAGENYTVEIQDGDFDTRENLNLFRSDDYAAADKVGTGTVVRRDPVQITGSGRITKVFVREGDSVSADDPLFEVITADADPGAGSAVLSPGDGVVASVAVVPGQQVWKGALLARIYLTARIEVIAEVDEMDLGRIQVGSVCPILLDLDEKTVLQGRVTEIGALGETRQNAAWFRVHLALEDASSLPLGASASVYLPKE